MLELLISTGIILVIYISDNIRYVLNNSHVQEEVENKIANWVGTMSEYNMLKAEDKINPHCVYRITDGYRDYTGIQGTQGFQIQIPHDMGVQDVRLVMEDYERNINNGYSTSELLMMASKCKILPDYRHNEIVQGYGEPYGRQGFEGTLYVDRNTYTYYSYAGCGEWTEIEGPGPNVYQ